MYDPAICITPKILEYISRIEASKAIIEHSPLIPLYERQFKTDATIRKIHYSTAIEGNYLNLNEVKQIVDNNIQSISDNEGNIMVARQRDFYEVINYRNLIKFIEKLTENYRLNKESFRLEKETIVEMHTIVLNNIHSALGEYRIGVAVSVNFLTGEKIYPYESAEAIEDKMDDLITWYNSTGKSINQILRAGLLHLEFVRIHPFEDGNGRMARALATLALSMDGYDIAHFFCLDEFYDSNAQDYYHYLGRGFENPTEWLEYFCLGVAIEFERIKERVSKISKDAKVKEKVGKMFINDRQEQIIEWLNNYGFIRNQDFENLFPNISEDTVLRELKGLIDNNIITKKGKTKLARYEFI
jgi:Fic family protein